MWSTISSLLNFSQFVVLLVNRGVTFDDDDDENRSQKFW